MDQLGPSWARLSPIFRCCLARCAGLPVPGPSWGHLWAIFGPSWAILEPSSAILGPFWAIFGPAWANMVPSWAPFSDAVVPGVLVFRCLGPLGPSWDHLGPFCRRLRPSRGHFEAILGHLRPLCGHLGPSWGHLWAILGAMYRCCLARCAGFSVSGPSWPILGPSCRQLQPS